MATDKKVRTNEEISADEELEDLFSDIDGTVIVKLTRLEPEYAEGYCGKFNITSGRPLTSHEIKNRFGGKVFQMVARDSSGKYLKKKIISISGLPKDEGRVINPDGSLQPIGDNDQHKPSARPSPGNNFEALEALSHLPIGQEAKALVMQEILGVKVDSKKTESQSVIDMMNLQTMMKFQREEKEAKQREREADLRYEKTLAEMRRDEAEWRRQMQQVEKPKDTFGGLQDMIKVFREMNGFKEEIGASGNEGIAQTLISSTIPMMENMMAEFMKLQQMKLQLSLQSSGQLPAANGGSPPELPARVSASRSNASLRVVDDEEDPEQFARRLGTMFQQMDSVTRQRMMNAFLQGEENIDENADNDTIDGDDISDIELLSDEDRELLDHDVENEQNENNHVSDSKHARSIDDHDPDNRQGNKSGIIIPAN